MGEVTAPQLPRSPLTTQVLQQTPHPLIHEINTLPWLAALREGLDLANVPQVTWDGLARYDAVWLVVVNLSDESAAAMARPSDDLAGHQVRLVDPTNDVTYDRSGDDVAAGLYVGLAPWGWQLFRVETGDVG